MSGDLFARPLGDLAAAGDEPVHAFLSVDLDAAATKARSSAGHPGALAGVPIAVKDNLSTTDFDSVGRKKVVVKYANLQSDWD